MVEKAYERSRGETFIGLFSKLLTRAVPGSDMTERGPVEDAQDEDTDGKPRRWFQFWRKKPAKIAHSQPASNAKVVNLVRGDTYEISQRFWDFSKLISQPIKVIFTMYFLVDIMGWTSSVGFVLMIFFLTVNSYLIKLIIKQERARTTASDRRAQAVAHFIEASRPLKLNGWTASWSKRIMVFRDKEMFIRLRQALTISGISTNNMLGGVVYPLSSICLYTLILKKGLPNEVIWPSLQLFSQLEASVREAFNLISGYWRATIPVERVHKYMAEQDRDQPAPGTVKDIEFNNASFAWPSTNTNVLNNINLTFPTGLTVIRGKVGSGEIKLAPRRYERDGVTQR